MSDSKARGVRLGDLVREAHAAGEMAELDRAWRDLLKQNAKTAFEAAPDAQGRFGMVGQSAAMHELYDLLEKVAPSQVSVLIQGETGTGKELVAHCLHVASPRANKPFLAENCAAVPANLLESELFGHVKGAFTGAHIDRKGTFVSADRGTVFLDEIGDMPLDMQSKLLRVLQDGEVRPVGSNKVQKVDVRLVAATNKDLEAMCRERTFREDLLYRINVITLRLPPLRERAGDVRMLAEFFAAQREGAHGVPMEFAESAMEALVQWSWPGNVRELENEIQRACVFADGRIELENLSPRIQAALSL